MVLDTRIGCTRAADGPNSALLASIMPNSNRHTLLAKADGRTIAGQFYLASDGHNAQIIYMAPELKPEDDDTAWLLALDAMAQESGKRQAHTLSAEVEEDSPLFVTMRRSGFAVYARQQLWGRSPDAPPILADETVRVRMATDKDAGAIYGLYSATMPKLLQQVSLPPDEHGFVYFQNETLMAFINVSEGRDGIYLAPFVHPDALPDAEAVLAATIAQFPRGSRSPITVRVLRHQGWLGTSLEMLGFSCYAQQAVMIRHIAAGVHSPRFSPLTTSFRRAQPNRIQEHAPEVFSN